MSKPGVGYVPPAGSVVQYSEDGATWKTGPFDPSALPWGPDGGGRWDRSAPPPNAAEYSRRYGGAQFGAQWRRYSGELLFAVGPLLAGAFQSGQLGTTAEYSGIPTWQELIDYASTADTRWQPAATKNDGSPASPYLVDVPAAAYGATWQIPGLGTAFNVHGSRDMPDRLTPQQAAILAAFVAKLGPAPPEPSVPSSTPSLAERLRAIAAELSSLADLAAKEGDQR